VTPPGTVSIIPIPGIAEVGERDNVAQLILDASREASIVWHTGDVLAVTHKVVSKAEGRVVAINSDADYRAVVEGESAAIIRRRGDLVIAQTRHGYICANAGVDRSNVSEGHAVLLPERPDRSAHTIRMAIEAETGVRIAVVVTDTFGRPWRRGLTDVAIGVSGIPAILDLRGTRDATGRVLDVTEIAIVDEIAAAADLVMGKALEIPAAIVRGLGLAPGDGRAADLVRPAEEDLFR
jgi:coenzyme F420-0:L-glutamate ligase/coenzyme F420-1:gamma-L-glutamate ligase